MRSSTGLYISRLDHVRALAAFLVYCWHFVHKTPNTAAGPDIFVFSLLEEGHVGVALFMTLSGYLFAKITDGRPISLPHFYRNRILRLAPLLIIVLAYWAVRGNLTLDAFAKGFILPTWSGGAWSVVVEAHFYALFPFILMLQQRGGGNGSRMRPLLLLLAAAVAMRAVTWLAIGNIQDFAYFTLGGCIDLFLAGMLWHELAKTKWVRRNAHMLFGGLTLLFLACWHMFNLAGGYHDLGADPAWGAIWIGLTTFEGLVLGGIIVGYEQARWSVPNWIDRPLARVGEASYSIYLMHFIFYPTLEKQAGLAGFAMDDLGTALVLAACTFPVVVAIAWVSYTLVERPFLALRVLYQKTPETTAGTRTA